MHAPGQAVLLVGIGLPYPQGFSEHRGLGKEVRGRKATLGSCHRYHRRESEKLHSKGLRGQEGERDGLERR